MTGNDVGCDPTLEGGSGAAPRKGILHILSYPGLWPVYVATLFVTGGQWVHNVVLAAYAYDVSGSAVTTGLVVLAQLGPLFVVGLPAGAIADTVDRRKLLRIAVSSQAVAAVLVALASTATSNQIPLLIVPAICCGIAQTFFLASYTSLLPLLVPASSLRQALALNSALLSLARVLGPALGAALYAMWGQLPPLAVVAALYLLVVITLGKVPSLKETTKRPKLSLRGLGTGFVVLRHDREIRRILVTISIYSIACVPFMNQMPAVAQEALSIGTKDLGYSLLFIAIGVGSLVGGLMTGTVLLRFDMAVLTRWLMYGFALLLATLTLAHSLMWGLVLMTLLGFTYFGIITTLITRLQIYLADEIRGRVMALWFMGFGGLLPVGAALAGPVIDHVSVAAMLAVGAVAAVPLGWYGGRPAGHEESPYRARTA